VRLKFSGIRRGEREFEAVTEIKGFSW